MQDDAINSVSQESQAGSTEPAAMPMPWVDSEGNLHQPVAESSHIRMVENPAPAPDEPRRPPATRAVTQARRGITVYSPERDLVYLVPQVLTDLAMHMEKCRNPQVREFRERHEYTEEQLVDGFCRLAEALARADKEKCPVNFLEALREQKYLETVPLPVQMELGYYLGLMLMGAAYEGCTVVYHEEAPYHRPFGRMIQAARQVRDRLMAPRWLRAYRAFRYHLRRLIGRSEVLVKEVE